MAPKPSADNWSPFLGTFRYCMVVMVVFLQSTYQNPAGSSLSHRTFAFCTNSQAGMARTTAARAEYGFRNDAAEKTVITIPTRTRYTKRTLTSYTSTLGESPQSQTMMPTA